MYHIIINPASRSGRGLKIWQTLVEPGLLQKEASYHPYFSRKSGDVARLVQEIISNEENPKPVTIIILGGDGTVNEALQGISDFSLVRLGYIPTGSSNDFARDLKIQNPCDALHKILENSQAHPMDVGTITYSNGEKRRFAVSCGIGFDAAVCEEALHSRIKLIFNRIGLGKLTYLGIALKQLLLAKNVACTLTLDNNAPISIPRIMFIACMLHQFEGGGFRFCPDAKADDGILNLCVVGNIPKLLILFALPTAFWGKHYFVKGITPYEAKEIQITTSVPLWVHTDGEVTQRTDSFKVTCEKQVLQFIR